MQKEKLVVLLKDILENGKTYNNVGMIMEAISDIEGEIRTGLNKNAGKTNLEAACKAVIKSAKKSGNRSLHGAWEKDGIQYVCDGYRIIANKNPIALERLDKNVLPPQLDGMFKNYCDDVEIELPTINELKSLVSEAKATSGNGRSRSKRYLYNANGLYLNAEFLLDALKATGNVNGTTKRHPQSGKMVCPLNIMSEDESVWCILLPVNPNGAAEIENGKVKCVS